MFKEERREFMFDWSWLGDVSEGRPNLGTTMYVNEYRLMQFTLRDVLIKRFGVETADTIFYDAGRQAGINFCRQTLNKEQDFNDFVAELQDKLKKYKIGILRIEHADLNTLCFILTVSEDLDCSGLPVCDEQICTYDEGFISGLLFEYTGRDFAVKEVDCWCSGERVCRFDVRPVQ